MKKAATQLPRKPKTVSRALRVTRRVAAAPSVKDNATAYDCHQPIVLDDVAFDAFVRTLENPPSPHPNMIAAFARSYPDASWPQA